MLVLPRYLAAYSYRILQHPLASDWLKILPFRKWQNPEIPPQRLKKMDFVINLKSLAPPLAAELLLWEPWAALNAVSISQELLDHLKSYWVSPCLFVATANPSRKSSKPLYLEISLVLGLGNTLLAHGRRRALFYLARPPLFIKTLLLTCAVSNSAVFTWRI